jgi:hypothetical protein
MPRTTKGKWKGILAVPMPESSFAEAIGYYSYLFFDKEPDQPRSQRWKKQYERRLMRALYDHFSLEPQTPDDQTKQLILRLAKEAGVPAFVDKAKPPAGRPRTETRVHIRVAVAIAKMLYPSMSVGKVCRKLAGTGPFRNHKPSALLAMYKKAGKDIDTKVAAVAMLFACEEDIEKAREAIRKESCQSSFLVAKGA